MNENVIKNNDGKDVPLPPENPIDEGIVVPVKPEDDKK